MYGALLYSAHRIYIETDVLATPLWYNAALVLLKPLYRWRIRKRAQSDAAHQQECCERFGPFQPPQHRHAIWFHAVSVGETNAAQPLIEHYLQAGHPVRSPIPPKRVKHVPRRFFKTALSGSFSSSLSTSRSGAFTA